jgi:hypothetical protein
MYGNLLAAYRLCAFGGDTMTNVTNSHAISQVTRCKACMTN